MRPLFIYSLLLVLLLTFSPSVIGGPTVVPTAEGQIGPSPGASDRVVGSRFESVRGGPGDVILSTAFIFSGAVPPPPEFSIFLDRVHGTPNPVQVDSAAVTFNPVIDLPPTIDWTPNAADDGDFIAVGYSSNGTQSNTMAIGIKTFDELGQPLATMTLDNIVIPPIPDPSLNDQGVAIDDQGRVTVAYTELNITGFVRVSAQRLDGLTGQLIDPSFQITDDGQAATDIALLDPAGNRLLIPSSDFAAIRGNIVDTTGGTPVVGPDFPISTTPALFANLNTAVAADTSTGQSIVAWENLSALQGDPVNVRARRFDANGNPVGDDFRVNTTTANAQAQPAVAMATGGLAAVVWAGDSGIQGDGLDTFMQIYGADGNPIDGEIKVNTTTTGTQDKPTVRFLPDDAQGNPQVMVVWRDAGNADGSNPNGTGTSYKCFSINGVVDPMPIFADGFEEGDTTSWSDTQN